MTFPDTEFLARAEKLIAARTQIQTALRAAEAELPAVEERLRDARQVLAHAVGQRTTGKTDYGVPSFPLMFEPDIIKL